MCLPNVSKTNYPQLTDCHLTFNQWVTGSNPVGLTNKIKVLEENLADVGAFLVRFLVRFAKNGGINCRT